MVQRLGHPSTRKVFSKSDYLIRKAQEYVTSASDITNDISKIALPTIILLADKNTPKESSQLLAATSASHVEFIIAIIFVTVQFIGLTAIVLHAAKPLKTLQKKDSYKETGFWEPVYD